MEAPVKFTPAAIQQLGILVKSLSLSENQYLRVGVKGGTGCMGAQHLLAFDHPSDQDEVFEQDGMKFLVRKGHSLYLAGLTIDYIETSESKGFTFNA